jgi:hypothetical protein
VSGNRRSNARLCILVGLGVFAVFAATASHGVPAGDSGELIAVAHVRGVAHPPGYPLYTMLAIAADALLPFGTAALRIDLLSALCGALAAALLCALARAAGGGALAGVLAAVVWAFAKPAWTYCGVAEVFALHVALAAAAALGVLALHRRLTSGASPRRAALATGLCFGLGMANHHTTLFVLLAALAFLGVEVARRRIGMRAACLALGPAALGGALGLLCYLYLPLAAAGEPAVSWGACDTWSGFWHHLLRRDYGTLRLVSAGIEGKDLPPLAHVFAFLGALGPYTCYLLPAGILLAFVAVRSAALGFLLLAFVCSGPLFLLLVNAPLDRPLLRGVVERFWILPLAFGAVLAGIGLQRACRWLPRFAALAVPGLAAAALLVTNHGAADHRGNTFPGDYARNILRCLPPDALLLSVSDLATNTLDHALHVEGERPDVVALDQAKLTYPWFVRDVARRHPGVRVPQPQDNAGWVAANPQRPVLFVHLADRGHEPRFVAEIHGLLWRLVPAERPTPIAELYATNLALWQSFDRDSLHRDYGEQTFEHDARGHYSELLFWLGWFAEQLGRLEDAAAHYAQSEALDARRWAAAFNLGLVLERLGRPGEAAAALERSLRPRPEGADTNAVRAKIRALRAR